jgi:GNAT superfamily N-acetyltransferase
MTYHKHMGLQGLIDSNRRFDRGAQLANPQRIFRLRPFRASDCVAIASSLTDIPALYPGGDIWLHRRLEDVVAHKAICTVAFVRRRLVGLTLEIQKGQGRRKLSTIFVNPAFRGLGVGSLLLENCFRSWEIAELEEAIVTVRLARMTSTGAFLLRNGFKRIAIQRNRYGYGQDEAILRWSPLGSPEDRVTQVN